MKLIYVAGPFRAKDAWEIEQNIRRAEELSLEIWRAGAVAICPHLNTRFFQGAAPDDVWLEGDKEIIRRCDAVCLVQNWEKSVGTQAEVALASEIGIPVLPSFGAFLRWFKGDK